MVHVDPVEDAEAFKSIEALWLQLRNQHPSDPDLTIGHAALVANDDRARSAEILRAALALVPTNADLWTELGRIDPEPSDRFHALQTARMLGSSQPNLLVWIGRSAVEAGRADDLYKVGSELMDRAKHTRVAIQLLVDWTDTGRAAWTRIRAELKHSPDRAQLIDALGQYANDLHWAHTFLGLVAVEQGHLPQAGRHLLDSLATWGEPRLTSYGPSFQLARKLCEAGLWKDVEEFLVVCRDFWDHEVLDDWIQDVRNEQLPDFDDE